jgi:hypothetical protein
MPIKFIYRERTTVESQMTELICNCCGKTAKMENGYWPNGFHVWDLEGGFGDHFPSDCEKFQIVVCEDCLKAWVKTFKLPDVSLGSWMCKKPLEATHSETEQKLLIAYGHAVVADEGDVEVQLGKAAFIEEEEGEDEPLPASIWQHFKGMRYQVLATVTLVPTRERMVVYVALYGDSEVWVRPLSMWEDHIERDGYSGPRFTQGSSPAPEPLEVVSRSVP